MSRSARQRFSKSVDSSPRKRNSRMLRKDADKSKMLVYTTREAIGEMAKLLQNGDGKNR